MKQNFLITLGSLLIAALLGFWIWYGNWVHFVEKHELGYTFSRLDGKIEALPHTGWVVRSPFKYTVNKIDLRPYQVSITASLGISDRILNAKLVRFNPEGLDTFIAWHGRGAGSDVTSLKEILKCYAFDKQEGRDCPFLTVVSELSPDQGMIIPQAEPANGNK